MSGLHATYSIAAFLAEIERPASLFYWKLMTPLTIVLLAARSSVLPPTQQLDARAADDAARIRYVRVDRIVMVALLLLFMCTSFVIVGIA